MRLAICHKEENRITVFEGRTQISTAKFTRMLEPDELDQFKADPDAFLAAVGYQE